MLNAVIIILRETMEASLLVGFLFIFSNYLFIDKKWMLKALIVGVMSAFLVAYLLPEISDLMDGVGQEVLFSTLLIILSSLIQIVIVLVLFANKRELIKSLFASIFTTIVILAISLEGAEIIVFFQSVLANKETFYPNLIGSVLGLGIGISIGAIGYYLISQVKVYGLYLSIFFLAMLSAGMISQVLAYMMQADFIESSYPIWNTSSIISERSIFGQLLYAMTGYEATPTLGQVMLYMAYLFIPLGLSLVHLQTNNKR